MFSFHLLSFCKRRRGAPSFLKSPHAGCVAQKIARVYYSRHFNLQGLVRLLPENCGFRAKMYDIYYRDWAVTACSIMVPRVEIVLARRRFLVSTTIV